MSYMNMKNARIRERGRKRSLFDKVNEIKDIIKSIFPEIDGDRLMAVMAHCRAYHEGKYYHGRRNSPYRRPRELTVNERMIYDYMLRNNLKPTTVYRWFLASRIPADIQALMRNGQVSVKKAFELSANRLRNRLSREGLVMIEEIRQIIRRY